jgi:hypothetical protein
MLFKNEIGIDENWTPREGMCSDVKTSAVTNQVWGCLILFKAILQFGKHCALHATLTNPMEFKTVKGHRGIVIAAKLLQERAGMFVNVQLKTLDVHVWKHSVRHQSHPCEALGRIGNDSGRCGHLRGHVLS